MWTGVMALLGASHDYVEVPKEGTNEIHADYYWSNIQKTMKRK
jgi:hypothetical protein